MKSQRNQQQMLKLACENFKEWKIYKVKVSPHKLFINYRESSNKVEKHDRCHFNQEITVKIAQNGTNQLTFCAS